MNIVFMADLIGFLATLTALLILYRGWKDQPGWNKVIETDAKLLLAGILLLTLFISFSNLLEWGGITKKLDIFEDYFEILEPILWVFFFYAFIKAFEISQRKKTEEELRQLQKQNDLILHSAGEGIYGLDTDGCTTFVNPAAAHMIGWEPRDLIGKSQHAVLHHSKPDGSAYDPKDCPIYAAFKDGRVHRVDTEVFWRKDGTSFPVEYISTPIRDDEGRLKGAAVTFRDITLRKKAEGELQSALSEKEVLLRELYHRTKNNMQVISSLLSLQSAHSDDEGISTVLGDMKCRIQSMALVHTKLSQSKNLSHIDMAEYIKDLTSLLLKSYEVSPDKIVIKSDLDEVEASIETAVPCGLILNELLTNALKHAFPDEKTGEINVTLKKEPDGLVMLTISDNGVGVPRNFKFRDSNTMGLQTIIGLVERQLNGKVQFEIDNGVSCQIQFKDDLYRKSV